jgi:hypothetical protein
MLACLKCTHCTGLVKRVQHAYIHYLYIRIAGYFFIAAVAPCDACVLERAVAQLQSQTTVILLGRAQYASQRDICCSVAELHVHEAACCNYMRLDEHAGDQQRQIIQSE